MLPSILLQCASCPRFNLALLQGDWVHMFPEGTRSRGGTLQPLKLGVGRMVTDATVPPLVVPFVHDGAHTPSAPSRLLEYVFDQPRISQLHRHVAQCLRFRAALPTSEVMVRNEVTV